MAKIVQIKGETIDADAFAKAYCENMNAERAASVSGCSSERAKEIGQFSRSVVFIHSLGTDFYAPSFFLNI